MDNYEETINKLVLLFPKETEVLVSINPNDEYGKEIASRLNIEYLNYWYVSKKFTKKSILFSWAMHADKRSHQLNLIMNDFDNLIGIVTIFHNYEVGTIDVDIPVYSIFKKMI